jgi:hypothetical protein
MSIEAARGIGDEAANAMDAAVQALMKRASARIAAEVATLDTDALGRIRPTAANIQRINTILDRVSATLFDDKYLDDVAKYLKGLNTVSGTVADTLRSLGADDAMLNAIARRAKAGAATQLLSTSSYRDLFGSVSSQLINGIVTAAEASAVLQGIAEVVDTSGIDRAVKSQIDSAPAAMQRAQTAAASEQAGIVFYRFQGRPIKTTRPWCLEREGKVWHVEEIREWGREAAAGKGWDGMIDGTNEQTIFTYLGGWYGDRAACRHILLPILRSRVPEEDLARMRGKGLID